MWTIKRWLGIRCLVLMCPGELINSKAIDGAVYWRCKDCGAHTKPRQEWLL